MKDLSPPQLNVLFLFTKFLFFILKNVYVLPESHIFTESNLRSTGVSK